MSIVGGVGAMVVRESASQCHWDGGLARTRSPAACWSTDEGPGYGGWHRLDSGLRSDPLRRCLAVGLNLTTTGTPTTTSIPVSDATTGPALRSSTTHWCHLESGSYSRVTGVSGTAPPSRSFGQPRVPDRTRRVGHAGSVRQHLASLQMPPSCNCWPRLRSRATRTPGEALLPGAGDRLRRGRRRRDRDRVVDWQPSPDYTLTGVDAALFAMSGDELTWADAPTMRRRSIDDGDNVYDVTVADNGSGR